MKKLLRKLSSHLSSFNSHFSSRKGFTLIELLIVIAIIAALAIAVFVALDPAKRVTDAKNARRTSDVDTILTAVHAAIVDNKGTLPSPLTTSYTQTQLGTGATGCNLAVNGCTSGGACVNLSASLDKYLKSIPVDPSGGTTYTAAKTGYTVAVDANNIVTVSACGAENSASVSASR